MMPLLQICSTGENGLWYMNYGQYEIISHSEGCNFTCLQQMSGCKYCAYKILEIENTFSLFPLTII